MDEHTAAAAKYRERAGRLAADRSVYDRFDAALAPLKEMKPLSPANLASCLAGVGRLLKGRGWLDLIPEHSGEGFGALMWKLIRYAASGAKVASLRSAIAEALAAGMTSHPGSDAPRPTDVSRDFLGGGSSGLRGQLLDAVEGRLRDDRQRERPDLFPPPPVPTPATAPTAGPAGERDPKGGAERTGGRRPLKEQNPALHALYLRIAKARQPGWGAGRLLSHFKRDGAFQELAKGADRKVCRNLFKAFLKWERKQSE